MALPRHGDRPALPCWYPVDPGPRDFRGAVGELDLHGVGRPLADVPDGDRHQPQRHGTWPDVDVGGRDRQVRTGQVDLDGTAVVGVIRFVEETFWVHLFFEDVVTRLDVGNVKVLPRKYLVVLVGPA